MDHHEFPEVFVRYGLLADMPPAPPHPGAWYVAIDTLPMPTLYICRVSDMTWQPFEAGGGAPDDAHYITVMPSGDLTNEFALSTLSDGVLKHSAGTPAVASGSDLNMTHGSQPANRVYAAPDGAPGTPSFRALTATDIPNLPGEKITSGTVARARLETMQGAIFGSPGQSGAVPAPAAADSGKFLRGDGTWGYAAIGEIPLPFEAGCRLSLSSTLPVPTSDISAATTLYLLPFTSSYIALRVSGVWALVSVGSGINTSLTGLDRHRIYDVFAYFSGGTINLELVAWNAPASATITNVSNAVNPTITTSAAHGFAVGDVVTNFGIGGATGANGTFRIGSTATATTFAIAQLSGANLAAPGVYTSGGTAVIGSAPGGTRATALATQDGILVKSGDVTRRYVGTLKADDAGGSVSDTLKKRLLNNYNNPVQRPMLSQQATSSWAFTGNGQYRVANNSYLNRLEWIQGYRELMVHLHYVIRGAGATVNTSQTVGIGIDSFSTNSASANMGGGSLSTLIAAHNNYVANVGYHHANPLEKGFNGESTTFFGLSTGVQTGFTGAVWG